MPKYITETEAMGKICPFITTAGTMPVNCKGKACMLWVDTPSGQGRCGVVK